MPTWLWSFPWHSVIFLIKPKQASPLAACSGFSGFGLQPASLVQLTASPFALASVPAQLDWAPDLVLVFYLSGPPLCTLRIASPAHMPRLSMRFPCLPRRTQVPSWTCSSLLPLWGRGRLLAHLVLWPLGPTFPVPNTAWAPRGCAAPLSLPVLCLLWRAQPEWWVPRAQCRWGPSPHATHLAISKRGPPEMEVCIVLACGLLEMALRDNDAHEKDGEDVPPRDSDLTWAAEKPCPLNPAFLLFVQTHVYPFSHMQIAVLRIWFFICFRVSSQNLTKGGAYTTLMALPLISVFGFFHLPAVGVLLLVGLAQKGAFCQGHP